MVALMVTTGTDTTDDQDIGEQRSQLLRRFRRFLSSVPRADADAQLNFVDSQGRERIITRRACSEAIDRMSPRMRKVVRLHLEDRETLIAIAKDCHCCAKQLELDLRRAVMILAALPAPERSLQAAEPLPPVPLPLAQRGQVRRILREFLRVVPREDEDDFCIFIGFDGRERTLTRRRATRAISRMPKRMRTVMSRHVERRRPLARLAERFECSVSTLEAERDDALDLLATLPLGCAVTAARRPNRTF